MTKQRNAGAIPDPSEIQETANVHLQAISWTAGEIDAITAEYIIAAEELKIRYEARLDPHKQILKADDATLKALMRHDKKYLFDGTDVVHLTNGSLIHNVADKVSIPRDALARCEELGFAEVVKIAKSLDRDAVEKWPDERLVLIGAERKSKEEFSYDLKEAKHGSTAQD